ncbi:hypothetical protein BaRGS_00010701 [Batillaria attramentaria]|uniref:Uncharacterized protein n=1 Tax=Batillaria attramentaria TaxID=370345 RepID=A0ABD0LFB0_9CAEN
MPAGSNTALYPGTGLGVTVLMSRPDSVRVGPRDPAGGRLTGGDKPPAPGEPDIHVWAGIRKTNKQKQPHCG